MRVRNRNYIHLFFSLPDCAGERSPKRKERKKKKNTQFIKRRSGPRRSHLRRPDHRIGGEKADLRLDWRTLSLKTKCADFTMKSATLGCHAHCRLESARRCKYTIAVFPRVMSSGDGSFVTPAVGQTNRSRCGGAQVEDGSFVPASCDKGTVPNWGGMIP